MLPKPLAMAVRFSLIAIALFSGVTQADSSSSGSTAAKLDLTIQDLKNETLQFNRSASDLERDTLYPLHSRLAVYLGVRVNNLLMKEINISIDNGSPHTITYDEKQGRALFQSSNIDRLLYINVPPGSHRIHADYTANYDGSKSDAKPITGSYDAFFDKTYSESELELVISRGRNNSKPAVTLKEWKRTK